MQSPTEAAEAVLAIEHPSIDEQSFRKYLPLFMYRATSTDNKLPVSDWLAVAGSPFMPVDVYNGKVYLFTVPPLLARENRLDYLPANFNISDVITQAKLKSEVMERLGENHLNEHLLSRLPPPPPINLSDAMQWNEIFKRYNLPLIPLPGMDKQKPTDKEQKEQVTFDGYEDL